MTNVANWVGELTTTTGAGDIDLGGALPGYTTFSEIGGSGTEVWYSVIDGQNREAGVGTLVGSTLQRTNVYATLVNGVYSDNNPAPISLSGAGAEVYCSFNKVAFDEFAAKIGPEGGVLIGQLKGISPVDPEDLTRKDYVDAAVASSPISSFDIASTYNAGDYVIYSGSLYKALQVTGPGWTLAHWTQMDAEGIRPQLAAKTDIGHLHDLSALTDSGANIGDVPQWDGNDWIPIDIQAGASVWGIIAGTLSNQTDLQNALDGKANSSHSHIVDDVTGLQAFLDGKASISHNHAIVDITGLQAALDGKAASSHGHDIVDVTGLQTALDGRAPVVHTHALSDLTQSGATNGQVPTWNGSTWEPQDSAGGSSDAILRAPTTTAENTITQSVDDQVPLRITPSPTSTAKQLEIGSVFTVDKDGALYAAGHVGIGRQPLANYELGISRPSAAPVDMTNGMIYANDLRTTVSSKTEGVFLAITQALQASQPNVTLFGGQNSSGEVFSVQADGSARFAGRLTVENDIKVINDAASSVSGPNGSALKLFSDGTGASHAGLAIGVGDAPAGDRFFISAKADAALVHGNGTNGGQFNVTTSGDIYGDGSAHFAGSVGIGVDPGSNHKARITADTSNQFGLFVEQLQHTASNCYAAYVNYGGGSAQAVGYHADAVGSGVAGSLGFQSVMQTAEANKSSSRHFRARVGSTDVFTVDGNGEGYFAGRLRVGGMSSTVSGLAAQGWHYLYRDSASATHEILTLASDIGGSKTTKISFKADGSITAAGDITAFSDRRLKENLERIPDAIDKVCLLSGYTYDRIDLGPGRHAGVIAQEVEAVLPEAVTTQDNKQGTKSVNHAALVGLLVEATKELHLENDRLRADVKELRQIVNQLARGQ